MEAPIQSEIFGLGQLGKKFGRTASIYSFRETGRLFTSFFSEMSVTFTHIPLNLISGIHLAKVISDDVEMDK